MGKSKRKTVHAYSETIQGHLIFMGGNNIMHSLFYFSLFIFLCFHSSFLEIFVDYITQENNSVIMLLTVAHIGSRL